MGQKTITIILCLLIVGGFVWYFNRNFIQNPSAISAQENAQNSEDNTISGDSLVYLNRGSVNEIWESSPSGKPKKVFTDQDETLKLTRISNLAVSAKTVLAVASTNTKTASKLILINLNTSKTKVLKESFPLPESLSLSSDGTYFSYVRFSNVEASYGHTLYIEEVAGSKLIEAFRSESELHSQVWDNSASKIAYAKSSGAKEEIFVYNLSTKKSTLLASQEGKVIDWLSWPNTDKLISCIRKSGDNRSGEIDSVSTSSGEFKKLVSFTGGIANFAYLDSTGQELTYLVAQYKSRVDSQTVGQIYINNLANNKKQSYQKSYQILGWLP